MKKNELLKCKKILDKLSTPLTGIERNRLMYELREIINSEVQRVNTKERG